MHVVQILPELNQGGVERGTVELNREFVKRGHHSTVISAGGKLVPQIEQDGGQHILLDVCSKNPLTVPRRVSELRLLISDLCPSVMHARSRVPAWLCYFANRQLQIPFVTTVHGFNSVSPYSRIMTRGDAVICVSAELKKYILRHYNVPEEKITVIHRGIDPAEFDPDTSDSTWIDAFRKEHGLTGKKVAVAVGRITELKDYETFIRAVAVCAKSTPDIAGLIVGGVRSDKRAYFERLQGLVGELDAEKHIVFADSQSRMLDIYALSDVLISSSKKPEAFGRTLTEALAMNTPVIASRHGGALDIVLEGQNGFFFTPGDADGLAERISEAFQFDFSNMREHIELNFSLNRMVEAELSVYAKLL